MKRSPEEEATTTPTIKPYTGDRIEDAVNNALYDGDKEFTQFPYKSITYHIHNAFMSHEFMGRMPLPHRMGSTLYTQKDLVKLKKGTGLAIDPTEDAEHLLWL